MGIRGQKTKLGVYAFAMVFALSLVSGIFAAPSASAATRTKCSATSPSYKQWQTTIQYGLANAFCIKDTHDAWLVWQDDGNLVWYVHGVARWHSNTYGRGKTFKLQSDANMVIYDASNKAIWASSWMKYNGFYWWTPGLTATGSCYFNVQVQYSQGTHSFSQGKSCPQMGGTFWQGNFKDAID